MTIAIRKIDLAKRLLDEEDEKILDRIDSILTDRSLTDEELVDKYTMKLEEDFDLEAFFKSQGKKQYNSEEMSRLAEEINITEPLEDLLKMLD